MTDDLQQFAATCHDILKAEPGPAGREKIRARLERALADPRFIAAQVTDRTPEREILYEDPELGFCILAHRYEHAKQGGPHDHGPSWAIYGQVRGETVMSDWEVVAPGADGKPAKVRKKKTYTLTPGHAHVYNEGDVHSPNRPGPSALIRIEGTNMDKVKRPKYEPA